MISHTLPDPGTAQRRAADPSRSVWVSASAGTGKTKVLTDRVLALLLAGTPPHRILCLTFTRAAAAEMANRINRSLAAWAIANNKSLQAEIAELTGQPADDAALRRAKTLFAQVLEVPGGMKIQTVHAFCESLLGRFPLEAGLAPHFQVMDEREASEIQHEAQARVLTRARYSETSPLARALAEVTSFVHEDEFLDLFKDLFSERGRLYRLISRYGGLEALTDAVFKTLDVSRDQSEQTIRDAASEDDQFDAGSLRAAATAMLQGSKTDKERGAIMAEWLAAERADRAQKLMSYVSVFFTQKGPRRAKLINKDAAALEPDAPDTLAIEAERLEAVLLKIRSVVTARATSAMLLLVQSLLTAYERCKRERGRLDYDDLILEARALLEAEGGASWVMFKLDGGIDHILIDEAQDTNPEQWEIIAALAEEFFAGEGAHDAERTLFAVGDPKQSIYSFQRADPEAFERMRSYFRGRATEIGKLWEDVSLDISFRSAASVLQMVDTVFSQEEARPGVVEPESILHHEAFRIGQAGIVELWPPVVPEEVEELQPWSPPVVARWGKDPQTRLADGIAAQIRTWIDQGEILKSKNRPLRPGDIMVLVRRRGAFVEKLVRALKRNNIPVAGVDRMVLSEQLAVRDLIALGEFLLLPEDELNLATVLKGPMIGFSEDELFDLAYDRGDENLWSVLRRRQDEKPIYTQAMDELSTLLARTDFTPPFELFADILGNRGGREKLLGRLGADANDPIDEFLSLAFDYERNQVPSLQGFLRWLDTGDVEVKRDLEQATRDEVRVMTVHGSKGLQAPVVFLPDSLQVPSQAPRLLWNADGMFLWPPRRRFAETQCEAALAAASETRDREYRRLLYVAMTRAEDRLYVCGWHTRRSAAKGNWYELIESAMENAGDAFDFDLTGIAPQGWPGTGWRLDNPQTAPVDQDAEIAPIAISAGVLPDWVKRLPPPERIPPRPLAPSRPDDHEPATRSPVGVGKEDSFRRGLIIHHLLQRLPELPVSDRAVAAQRYLARPIHDLSGDDQQSYAEEVLAVLSDAEFADLFGPGSRAEVPITGNLGIHVVAGQVDRLIVQDDRVQVIDYKSNRPPPGDAVDVSPVYLRQMAAYRAVLLEAFPGRTIDCALLWTDAPHLMKLPAELLDGYFVDQGA
ncbi:MAG: double-strand break repair helicase AddA [Alphaproteobacteria bacterium]|nr:double-strand break repair helicase AddA [Alphaproteobacteria bacterium]